MRTNAIIRIVIFSLVILILLAVLLGGLGIGSLVVRFTSHVTESQETIITGSSNQFSPNEIRNLNIDWVNGNITLQPGDTNVITVSESGNFPENNEMFCRQSGDTLTIQFSKTKVSMNIDFNFSKDLVITVPRDWQCEELDISSVSANIDVTDLIAEEIDLENVSGTCAFEACITDELTVETVSGNVSYNGTLNTMDCNTVSANCTLVTGSAPSNLSMDSVSGDLILELPESCGFTADIDSMSGTISSEFETTASGNRHTYGNGNCRISADTMSGDIIIQKS